MNRVQRVVCPACHKPCTWPVSPGVCPACGAALVLLGKYALTRAPPAGLAPDELDGAVPLREGVELASGTRVAVRVGGVGQVARLEREATVLRGLRLANVPRVLDLEEMPGVGMVLVTSHPAGRCLEDALAAGLRTDAVAVRQLLRGLLETLVALHGLSPPVFHRNIHSGSVFWDGEGQVALWDFARATDTAEDHAADLVLARPGFTPVASDVSAAQAELYAVGAVAVHVLSRRLPDALPQVEGRPDFRAQVRVDETLAVFLERLLAAGTRRAFRDAAEALQALQPAPSRNGALALVWGSGIVGVVFAAFLATTMFLGEPSPATVERPGAVPPTFPEPKEKPQEREAAPTPVSPAPEQQARVMLKSSPTGAWVRQDGRNEPLGKTPMLVGVAPGSNVVWTFSLEGYRDARLQVEPRDHAQHTVTLEPVKVVEVPSMDDAWRRSVEKVVAGMQGPLTACNVDHQDRVRVTLSIRPSGDVEDAKPMGAARAEGTQCVVKALAATRFPARQDANALSVDVWVYFKPAFKAAAY